MNIELKSMDTMKNIRNRYFIQANVSVNVLGFNLYQVYAGTYDTI